MAVLTVKEKAQERTSTENYKNKKTYSRTWEVVTDDPKDGQYAVNVAWNSSTGISAGDTYATSTEYDNNAYALDIRINCIEAQQWLVTCNYGPLPETELNPLLQPASFKWDYHQFERPTDFDIYGNAIVNSAYDPYLNPVMREDSRPILTVTQNEADYPALLAWYYQNAVNGTVFLGAPVGTVKVAISSHDEKDQTYGRYWNTQYVFQFSGDPQGWKRRLLDQGLRGYDTTGLKGDIVPEGGGAPVSSPVLLNGFGKALPDGNPPIFYDWEIYPYLPFNIFSFRT